MRSRFDEQLALLNEELISMGSLCVQAIELILTSLSDKDVQTVKNVRPLDNEIDQKERDIESLCMKLLLRQQPVARDFLQISAALKMITDMERIGDQCDDIAEIIISLDGRTLKQNIEINEMGKATMKMVTDSVDAYVKKDIKIAQDVITYDDIVDEYFNNIKQTLINDIAQNPEDGEVAIDMLMIAKYFERIGDHATNIAEWVLFSINGDKGPKLN